MNRPTRRRVIYGLRIATIVISAVSAFLLTWDQASPSFEITQGWTLFLILVVALAAVGEQLRALIVKIRAPRKHEYERALELALTDLLLAVSDATGYDRKGLGCSAYKVRKPLWFSRREPELDRQGRRRFTDLPQPSAWVWTKGVGVIGMCWQDNRPFYRDLRGAALRYGDGSISAARYVKVGKDLKLNMTLEQFQDMIGKYGEVLAMPIKDPEGNFLGCLAVDVASTACSPAETPKLKSDAVQKMVASSAAVIAKMYQHR